MKLFTLLFFLFASFLYAEERDLSHGIIFCTYNVRNYIGNDQAALPEHRAKVKSEAEIEALVAIIREISPDVFGVCEMGSPAMFEDFKARLEKAGLGYVDSEYLQAEDPDRHLALLSRFPIVARDSRKEVLFKTEGRELGMKRGILDVTVQITPEYRLRCVGVHLKSKLAIPEGEALIRRHEAAKLREHLDVILKDAPETNLLCYGDCNDARNEPVYSTIKGTRGTPTYMADLPATDNVGDRWTYYWQVADEYTRIDYLFVSPGLWPEVQREIATVYRAADWEKASDHRPVYVTIKVVEKARKKR